MAMSFLSTHPAHGKSLLFIEAASISFIFRYRTLFSLLTVVCHQQMAATFSLIEIQDVNQEGEGTTEGKVQRQRQPSSIRVTLH